MFSARASVRPLMPISRDTISLQLLERFRRNAPQMFITWVVARGGKRFSRSWGQRSRSCVYRCMNAITAKVYILTVWPALMLLVFSERELTFAFAICRRPSVCRLSVVCNVRAPYSGDWNFRKYFYAIWYVGHLWPFGKNFTEIVPGEPLRRRS